MKDFCHVTIVWVVVETARFDKLGMLSSVDVGGGAAARS